MADEDQTAGVPAEYREAFNMLDTDHDGSVSLKEMAELMAKLGQDVTSFELIDTVNDAEETGGTLDYLEFVTVMNSKMANRAEGAEEEEYKAAFKLFDQAGSGKVEAAQLKKVLTMLGETVEDGDVAEILREHGDGKALTYPQFASMLASGAGDM